jgi:hypothetical protein
VHIKCREHLRLSLFVEQYNTNGDEFLNQIIRVPGDETLVSFVIAETKEQSKKQIHIQQTS